MIFFLSKCNATLEFSPHIMIVKQGLAVAWGITLIQLISIFSHLVQCTIERRDKYWNSVLRDKYHFIAPYYKIMLHFLLSCVGLTKKKKSLRGFLKVTNKVTVLRQGIKEFWVKMSCFLCCSLNSTESLQSMCYDLRFNNNCGRNYGWPVDKWLGWLRNQFL